MNYLGKENPAYEVLQALVKKFQTRYRAARAAAERLRIPEHKALAIFAGEQSPTVDQLADMALLAEVELQIVVRLPRRVGGVAA